MVDDPRIQRSIVIRAIDELIASEYNPRQLTQAQAEHLKASLQRFGFVDPVIVNMHPERRNIIIGGHQRVNIAKLMGFETAPCIELNLSRDQERELNIRLNKNTGEWDFDQLADHFDISELLSWGFEKWELPPLPEMGGTATGDKEKRTFSPDEIEEVDPVNYNIAQCPKCGHKFIPRKRADYRLGHDLYVTKQGSNDGKSISPPSTDSMTNLSESTGP
jgi:hypothetical protein